VSKEKCRRFQLHSKHKTHTVKNATEFSFFVVLLAVVCSMGNSIGLVGEQARAVRIPESTVSHKCAQHYNQKRFMQLNT
jgi:hypothetical protein